MQTLGDQVAKAEKLTVFGLQGAGIISGPLKYLNDPCG